MKVFTNNDFLGLGVNETVGAIRNEFYYADAFGETITIRFSRMYAGNSIGKAVIGSKWVRENLTVHNHKDCVTLEKRG